MINQTLFQGHQSNAGEWGHNPLPWPREDESPGPLCWCGLHGCIETYLSGPGLARDHGSGASAAEIFALADQDSQARASLDRYEDRLARSLASIINVVDPAVIVLGGGVSNASGLIERVQPRLSEYVFSDQVSAHLVRNQHGDSSGVRGAAWLWAADEV